MNKTRFYILLLILFSILQSLSLFKPNFYSTHDGVTHVARLVQFNQGLLDGQIIPRWADGIAFNLGSPVLMFNSYLPYLTAEIPRILGASFSSSIEIILFLSLIFSAIAFYFWMKDIFGDTPAFVGALLYIWAPYRFVDIYVRGAYPESFAFIFPPIILLASKKLTEGFQKKWFAVGTLSLVGLILSHNVMAILFMSVLVIYVSFLCLAKKKWRNLRFIFLEIIVALSLSAFFWLPAFWEKGSANLDYMNSTASYINNFVTLNQIIYSKWGWGPLHSGSPMSPQLGLVQELVAVFAFLTAIIVTYFKKKQIKKFLETKISNLQWVHVYLFTFLLVTALFLMTAYSSFLWSNISLLSFFLYPWRFLTLAIFSAAVLASFFVYVAKSNKLVVIALVILILYCNRNYSQLVGVVQDNDYFFKSYTDTTDMWGEFLPRQANLDTISKCKKEKCVFEKIITPEFVNVFDINRKSNDLSFRYISSQDFQGTINTFFFPGWNIFIDNNQSGNIKVNNLGTMDVSLPGGNHLVEAKFMDTPVVKLSKYFSIGAAIIFLSILLWKRQSRHS